MLWIMGLGFGSFILYFLIRRLTKQMTSFEDYRRQHDETLLQAERQRKKGLLTLPASETLAPITAGIREMLDLHGTGAGCIVQSLVNPPRIEVTTPSGILIVQYRLRPTGRVRSGCYWEVKTPDDAHVCRNLNDVMRHIERYLEVNGYMERPFI